MPVTEVPDLKFNTMLVHTMTNAKLIATNVPEADYPVWAVGTTYAAKARVIVIGSTHAIYESIAGGNVGHDPVADVDPVTGAGTYWLKVSATNRWKCFDGKVSTPTTITTPGFISYTILPGIIVDTIAIFGVNAPSPTADLTIVINGTQVFYSAIGDGLFLVTDLEIGATDEFTIDIIDMESSGEPLSVGQITFGNSGVIGDLLTGGSIGLIDYSTKEIDTFGNTLIIERGYAPRVDFRVSIPAQNGMAVFTKMARVRARPTVFHGGAESMPYGLVIFGTLNDFQIDQPDTKFSTLSVSVNGLV